MENNKINAEQLAVNMLLSIGDGTEDNPFIIMDAQEFQAISNNLNAYYRLGADVDFDNGIITPIGTVSVPFKGGLDGDGYAVRNFRISSAVYDVGLFGIAQESTFKNLTIENGVIEQLSTCRYIGTLAGELKTCSVENISVINVTISGGSYAGALVGDMSGGSIKGCSVRGECFVSGISNVGGLIGYGSNTIIEECLVVSTGKVNGTAYAGGLLGTLFGGSVLYCAATISVTGSKDNVGGLIGQAYNGVTIKECYATGDVIGNYNLGGLIGNATATISDSFATGKVSSSTSSFYAGGLIGYCNKGSIKNCFSVGQVSAKGSGLIYVISTGTTVTNSYFDGTAIVMTESNTYNVSKLTIKMMKKNSYPDWDFDNVWEIEEGSTYPYLQNVEKLGEHRRDISNQPEGEGTRENPYLLDTPGKFECIKYELNGYYKLEADINFDNNTIVPAGTLNIPFKGGLDGNGYAIRNFIINSAINYTGLFEYAQGAIFKNLTIENGTITKANTNNYVGALAGGLSECSVENINLINVTVSGGQYAGALIGYMKKGSVKRCFVREECLVSGKNSTGGLIGYALNASIEECSVLSTGKVSGKDYIGGLIGEQSGGNVLYCTVSILVEGESNIGGLMGCSVNGTIVKECYATGDVTGSVNIGGLIGNATATVTDSFATGQVTSSTSSIYTGGLIGYCNKGIVKNCFSVGKVSEKGSGLIYVYSTGTTVTNSYFDGIAAGVVESNAYNVSKLTISMMKQSSYREWDFDNIWRIEEGSTYPYLQKLEQPREHWGDISNQPEGKGTREEPYLIETTAQFECIRYDTNGYYRLGADIDFADSIIIELGTKTTPFKGEFDGNGYTVRNFSVTSAVSHTGMFGYAQNASFKNLIIENGIVTKSTGKSYAGVLAGELSECSVENISLINVTVSGGNEIGALIGKMSGGSIKGCSVRGECFVSGSSNIGGLIGYALYVNIEDCLVLSMGEVSGTGVAGGLIGVLSGGTALRCTATISVVGGSNVGGLMGQANVGAVITQCYAAGEVTGKTHIGGLLGNITATVTDSFATCQVISSTGSIYTGGLIGYCSKGSIKNCFSAGKVSEKGSGLIYVYSTGTTVTNSYFDGIVAGDVESNAYNVNKLTVGMMKRISYLGWDFDNVWEIEEGSTYPYLQNVEQPEKHWGGTSNQPNGEGTSKNPYLIDTVEKFEYMRYETTGFYRLEANIDFNNTILKEIGTEVAPFKGGFDGNGYAVRNFKICSAVNYTGIFGCASGAIFKNLTIENGTITKSTSYKYAGALAGELSECTAENISLVNITVSGGNFIGALTGHVSKGSIKRCSVSGECFTTGISSVGGLIGHATSASVEECLTLSMGKVSGTGPIGGLIGNLIGGNVLRCMASILVDGVSNVGGLTGQSISGAVVAQCYAIADVTGNTNIGGLIGNITTAVTDSFAIGQVTSSTSSIYTGGLIGNNTGGSVKNCYFSGKVSTNGNGLIRLTTVTNSYFDSTTTGIKTPTAQARTTVQMMQKGNYIGWNWNNIWNYQENTLPSLANIPSIIYFKPFELTLSNLTNCSALIEWTEFPGAIEYEISYLDYILYSNIPMVLVEGLTADTEYEFKVRAKTNKITGVWSNPLQIRTKKPHPQIRGLHTTNKDTDSITLTWSPVEDVQQYEITCDNRAITTGLTSHTITGLHPGKPYTINVSALFSDGSKIEGNPITEKIYVLNPQTPYAGEFINSCQEQTWFIDEIENLLNLKGKSINTIQSSADLATIYAIGLADRNISGQIPTAIGELRNLQYLYMSNNNISGDLPTELEQLDKLIIADLSGNDIS